MNECILENVVRGCGWGTVIALLNVMNKVESK